MIQCLLFQLCVPQRATKLFANAAAKFDVPVFLIEPECLENISMYVALHKNNQNSRNCNYLCGSRTVTTFGILDASRISDVSISGSSAWFGNLSPFFFFI